MLLCIRFWWGAYHEFHINYAIISNILIFGLFTGFVTITRQWMIVFVYLCCSFCDEGPLNVKALEYEFLICRHTLHP